MIHFLEFLGYLILILQIVFSLYLIIPFLFYSIHIIRKKLKRPPRINQLPVVTNEVAFNIIVTAHQEAAFIYPLVDSLEKQVYRGCNVFIVADNIEEQIIFDDDRVKILYPQHPLNSKIASIAFAMEHIVDPASVVLILDADNLLHPEYLNVLNQYFQKGFDVVQSDFKAKNTETPIALMDAVGDLYNFFVDREMRMELGISSAIWGAGIAFRRALYDGIDYIDNLGGFDKKLQIHLASSVKRIAFASEAVLYDEKIVDAHALQRQRTRWISAQMKYMRENLQFFFHAICKMDFNRIYFGFANIRPPLFMTLGIAMLFMLTALLWIPLLAIYWFVCLTLFCVGFVSIVRMKTREMRYQNALKGLPSFLLSQVLASLQLGKAKKSFMKTKHHHPVYIDEILRKH